MWQPWKSWWREIQKIGQKFRSWKFNTSYYKLAYSKYVVKKKQSILSKMYFWNVYFALACVHAFKYNILEQTIINLNFCVWGKEVNPAIATVLCLCTNGTSSNSSRGYVDWWWSWLGKRKRWGPHYWQEEEKDACRTYQDQSVWAPAHYLGGFQSLQLTCSLFTMSLSIS